MRINNFRKKLIIIGSVILVLVVARLMLPYFVTRHVNKVLDDIPGYSGSIADVNIHLIRGAYTIRDLKILKVDGIENVPFVDIPAIDFSIEWSAVFKGAAAGAIVFKDPTLRFIGGDKKNAAGITTNQTGENVDWIASLRRLLPFGIDRLEIENGSIFFYDFTTQPEVNIFLKQLRLSATNLSNLDKQNIALPSKVSATAISIGNGQLKVDMNMNVLKEIPSFDMDMKFENINMVPLNDFFSAYAKVDVEKGTFSMYSQLTINDGKLSGYINPLAQDVKIARWKNDKEPGINVIWHSIVGFFVEVFTNQEKDQFTTKVNLDGDLNNVKTQVWPTIWNIFKKGFVSAFEKSTDNTIKFTPRKIEETKKEKRKKERERKRKQESP